MPGRSVPLIDGEYYHLFNRGINKQKIFLQTRDYKRFKDTFFYYQFLKPHPKFSLLSKTQFKNFKPTIDSKLVEIICYCIMPNHFHFLVRQLRQNGISIFMSQLINSYTKYFNVKYGFIGPALQGTFKSDLVENDEQLIHLSRYIHLNPVVSNICNDPIKYLWSSYIEYFAEFPGICNKDPVLNLFPSSERYKEFVRDQISYGITLEILKHKTLED